MSAHRTPEEAYMRLMRERLHTVVAESRPTTNQEKATEALRRIVHLLADELDQDRRATDLVTRLNRTA